MNDGAAAAQGEVLVFMNNDVEPLDSGWLDELVRQAWRPAVGAVGAKLLYPDRKVQHAGVAMAGVWVARHVGVGAPDHAAGYAGRMTCVQAQSAVTGARSEEHTSELQSLIRTSYAVFFLKQKET